MGTEVTVLGPAERMEEAAAAVEAVFVEWDLALSRFRPDSELSRLNAAGRGAASAVLFAVVEAAIAAARRTHGVFDPTLLPHLIAAGYDRDFADIGGGEPVQLAPAPPATGSWRGIELDSATRRIVLPPGAGLDLGGIAKGMAVDAAGRELDRLGVAWHAVDAGGDLAVRGIPDGLEVWPVAVEAGARDLVIGLREGALATSSVLGRRWKVGSEERHHLIDPRTGLSSRSAIVSVTAAATTCEHAEVAAKAALILGPEFGPPMLSSLATAGLITLDSGRRIRVGSWPEAA